MTSDELKVLAKEYVSLCMDEVKDESYDYAADELELEHEQCEIFTQLVSSVIVQ